LLIKALVDIQMGARPTRRFAYVPGDMDAAMSDSARLPGRDADWRYGKPAISRVEIEQGENRMWQRVITFNLALILALPEELMLRMRRRKSPGRHLPLGCVIETSAS